MLRYMLPPPNSTDGAATAPRAAATNGKWNLAITLKSDVTKDNITKVFGAWDNSTYKCKIVRFTY